MSYCLTALLRGINMDARAGQTGATRIGSTRHDVKPLSRVIMCPLLTESGSPRCIMAPYTFAITAMRFHHLSGGMRQ